MTDDRDNSVTPPPLAPVKRVRLGPVTSYAKARRAMIRITQAMLDGILEPKVANAAIYGLSTWARTLEAEDIVAIQTRLALLEERAAEIQPLAPRTDLRIVRRA